VVVLPSYREGKPKTLLEAAACGRPIITSDIPGCRDIVRHGVNGLLVQPRDSQALALAMQSLGEDRVLRDQMGLAGRTRATAFSVEDVVEHTLRVYATVLHEQRHELAGEVTAS
jgi:glycosyltransferase involved in cell wall biosynthesis